MQVLILALGVEPKMINSSGYRGKNRYNYILQQAGKIQKLISTIRSRTVRDASIRGGGP